MILCRLYTIAHRLLSRLGARHPWRDDRLRDRLQGRALVGVCRHLRVGGQVELVPPHAEGGPLRIWKDPAP